MYLYVVVIQREQAEREQDWEQEQREKREALEAAQRELEEVLDSNSAWLGYSMISSCTNYISKSRSILNSYVLLSCQVFMYLWATWLAIVIVCCYSRASVMAHFIILAPTKS